MERVETLAKRFRIFQLGFFRVFLQEREMRVSSLSPAAAWHVGATRTVFSRVRMKKLDSN